MRLLAAAALLVLAAAGDPATADLTGKVLQRYAARDANQGVAVDRRRFYVVDNRSLVTFDRATGRELMRWSGDPARFVHLNSCVVLKTELVCAHSNYPTVPMRSTVETFDARTLRHKHSRSLGDGIGSLTWIAPHKGSWWAGFANYDGRGGVPGRDHRFTTLVRYDRSFVEQRRWRFDPKLLARFAPRSMSGGTWSDDGLLYLSGHDAREVYAVSVPEAGDIVRYRATIRMDTPGQAIAWDPTGRRLLWSIDRERREVVVTQLPPIAD